MVFFKANHQFLGVKTASDDEWFFADKSILKTTRQEKDERNFEEYKAGKDAEPLSEPEHDFDEWKMMSKSVYIRTHFN